MQSREVQVIYLDREDDIVSICDRLKWASASRVLLVMHDSREQPHSRLDMLLLARSANALALQIALVTGDHRASRAAAAAGIPRFHSVPQAMRRKVWRRSRMRQLARPQSLHQDDRREMHRRLNPPSLWRRWMARYVAVVVFFVGLATLFIGIVYAVPSATITLYPQIQPVRAVRQIVADPQLESVSSSGASVPARRVVAVAEWQTGVETTGAIDVPDAPARGNVVFVNRQETPVEIPAGTRVSTTGAERIVFQTIEASTVPGAVGASAQSDIIAILPGEDGNVEPGSINRVEGSLALALEVRNLEATTGGGNRLARAVTEADQSRLKAQVLQQLQSLALAEMEAQLGENEFLARESLRLIDITQETFSHFPGEQSDRLILELQAELQATAIDRTQAIGLVYDELTRAIEPGHVLVPRSFRFESGRILGVDNQGRVSLEMIGEGVMAAELQLEGPVNAIAGQPKATALAYLHQQLPLRVFPSVRITPGWLTRMPYLTARIRVNIIDTTG